jgi:hypothetical protein
VPYFYFEVAPRICLGRYFSRRDQKTARTPCKTCGQLRISGGVSEKKPPIVPRSVGLSEVFFRGPPRIPTPGQTLAPGIPRFSRISGPGAQFPGIPPISPGFPRFRAPGPENRGKRPPPGGGPDLGFRTPKTGKSGKSGPGAEKPEKRPKTS